MNVGRTLVCLSVLTAFAACGRSSTSADTSVGVQRAAIATYLRQVEPIRLGVDQLLEGADPILSEYRSGRLSPRDASRAMSLLEGRFAAYTVDIAAVQPGTPELRSLHGPYAHTYILEDSYLSALASGLATRNVAGLPDTQASQRAAIIEWRTALAVLARRVGLKLPDDLQTAGRGEIAPSPGAS